MSIRFGITLLMALSATSAQAETCGKDKSGQGVSCDGICCPSSGTWSCAPLGATCCYDTGRVGKGMYCAAGSVCFDTENCMPGDSFSTFPATPGTSGKPTQVTWSVMQTVYDGPVPTTGKGNAGGGQVVTSAGPTITGDGPAATGSATGQVQGTGTGKPNGAGGSDFGQSSMLAVLLGAMSMAWIGMLGL